MTGAERDNTLAVLKAAANDLPLAQRITGLKALSAEQAEAIMEKVAYIFSTIASADPGITSKVAIARAVRCAYEEIQPASLQELHKKVAEKPSKYQNSLA